jgi:hypothetical protein
MKVTHTGSLEGTTGNALVGHSKRNSSLDACPKSEKEDTIADLPRFPVKFAELLVTKPSNNQSETHSNMENPFQRLVGSPVDHEV